MSTTSSIARSLEPPTRESESQARREGAALGIAPERASLSGEVVDLRPLAFDPGRDDVPVPPAKLEGFANASFGGTVAGRLVRDGIRLFSWRSYLPLLLLVPGLLAARERFLIGPAIPQIPSGAWLWACAALALVGQVIRVFTVGRVPDGTCGRNINHLRASSLNTLGLYSVVRNPLYLGNYVIVLAFALAFRVPWFALVVVLAYWIYIDRIIAVEEHYLNLRFGDQFRRWALRVPALLPKPGLWQPSDLALCWRTVARREYNGAFLIVNFFLLVRLAEAFLFEGHSAAVWWQNEGRPWLVGWALALLVFTVLRTLKRRTRVLHVDGR